MYKVAYELEPCIGIIKRLVKKVNHVDTVAHGTTELDLRGYASILLPNEGDCTI